MINFKLLCFVFSSLSMAVVVFVMRNTKRTDHQWIRDFTLLAIWLLLLGEYFD